MNSSNEFLIVSFFSKSLSLFSLWIQICRLWNIKSSNFLSSRVYYKCLYMEMKISTYLDSLLIWNWLISFSLLNYFLSICIIYQQKICYYTILYFFSILFLILRKEESKSYKICRLKCEITPQFIDNKW